ncbi:MAG TPA: hypothetical protein VE133_05265 [Candidatus Sulfotelmatobacter sp.]|nr:hypothetical protein [Candidatus Sulfotelmatobacter sp.]
MIREGTELRNRPNKSWEAVFALAGGKLLASQLFGVTAFEPLILIVAIVAPGALRPDVQYFPGETGCQDRPDAGALRTE